MKIQNGGLIPRSFPRGGSFENFVYGVCRQGLTPVPRYTLNYMQDYHTAIEPGCHFNPVFDQSHSCQSLIFPQGAVFFFNPGGGVQVEKLKTIFFQPRFYTIHFVSGVDKIGVEVIGPVNLTEPGVGNTTEIGSPVLFWL